jgi:hypothetical protein
MDIIQDKIRQHYKGGDSMTDKIIEMLDQLKAEMKESIEMQKSYQLDLAYDDLKKVLNRILYINNHL